MQLGNRLCADYGRGREKGFLRRRCGMGRGWRLCWWWLLDNHFERSSKGHRAMRSGNVSIVGEFLLPGDSGGSPRVALAWGLGQIPCVDIQSLWGQVGGGCQEAVRCKECFVIEKRRRILPQATKILKISGRDGGKPLSVNQHSFI